MNSKNLSLIVNIVIAVLAIIGIYFVVSAMGTKLDPETDQPVGDTAAVSSSVSFSLFLVYACLTLIGVFTIWAIIVNPKRFIPTFIALGSFILIFIIVYAMSSDKAEGPLLKLEAATPFWLTWTDTGITMTFVLMVIAIVFLLVGVIRNGLAFFSK